MSAQTELLPLIAEPPPRLTMSAAEAARELGVSRNRIYELCAAGMLPHVRFGRTLRLPRRALDEAINRAGIQYQEAVRSQLAPKP